MKKSKIKIKIYMNLNTEIMIMKKIDLIFQKVNTFTIFIKIKYIVSDDDDLMLNQSSLIDIKYVNIYQTNQDRISKSDHRNETKISKDIDDLDNYSGGMNRLELGENIEGYEGEEEQDNQNLWDRFQELSKDQHKNEQNNVVLNDADNDNNM